MKSSKLFFIGVSSILLFSACLIFSSCQGNADKTEPASLHSKTVLDKPAAPPPSTTPRLSSENLEVKTFEVKNAAGKSTGWGYDIYSGNNKAIHQPIIPAIPGNRPFKTEDDAMKTGLLALGKMKTGGSLPTLSVKELDSLGVTK